MKFMKKSTMTFVVAMTLCMLFAFTVKLNVSASTVRYITSDGKSVSISFPSKSYTKYEVQLFNRAKKLVATTECWSSALFYNNTSKNKLYYYRARPLTYNSSTYSYAPSAKWSALKPFTTVTKCTVKIAGKKSKAVNLKLPKVKGVSSYTVYLSTKSTGGFKKVKTAKPGKVVKLSKYKGKTFKYYKNYYYKVVPKVKKQKAPAITGGFYIYRTYY